MEMSQQSFLLQTSSCDRWQTRDGATLTFTRQDIDSKRCHAVQLVKSSPLSYKLPQLDHFWECCTVCWHNLHLWVTTPEILYFIWCSGSIFLSVSVRFLIQIETKFWGPSSGSIVANFLTLTMAKGSKRHLQSPLEPFRSWNGLKPPSGPTVVSESCFSPGIVRQANLSFSGITTKLQLTPG